MAKPLHVFINQKYRQRQSRKYRLKVLIRGRCKISQIYVKISKIAVNLWAVSLSDLERNEVII